MIEPAQIAPAESAEIVAWARMRGSNATDLRDAVHEICHGITVTLGFGGGLRLARESIHAGLTLWLGRAGLFEDECLARACERLACDLAGQPCGDFRMNSYLEAHRVGVVADPAEWAAGIDAQAERGAVRLAEIRRLVATPRARPRRGC